MFARSLSLLSALVLISCGGDDTKTDGPAGPAPGHETRDTLVVGQMADMGNLISIVNESASTTDILDNLSFQIINSDFDCSLKKVPGLATEWSWSDDGKTLSMTLRDDITFQDGSKVTADDIAFTWELISDKDVASPRISYVERMTEDGRPKVIDPTHIEWHFTEAYDRDSQMSHASAMSVVPRAHLGTADRKTLRGHRMSKEPMATGPWKLAKWEPNTRIVLEPNENFTGPPEFRAHLDRVILKILPEYTTRLIELQGGKIDMMESINVEDADRIRKENPEIKLIRRGWRSNDYIAWNQTNPIFADKKVRTALAHAVDINDMIAKLLTSETGEAFARPSVGTITPALCGVHNDDIVPLSYNLEKAKELLAEAGWTDSDADGILDKDGKKLEFLLSTNNGNKRRASIQILVQAQLQKIGVKVNLEKQEANTFFENLRKKDYEAAVAGWSASLFIDPESIWHCDTNDRKYEFNFVNYCNPKVDKLIEKGLMTPDPKDAAPIWKEMQATIYEDQPYLFLWWIDEIVGIHERFDNVQVDVLSPLHNLHAWEVPPEKVKYKR